MAATEFNKSFLGIIFRIIGWIFRKIFGIKSKPKSSDEITEKQTKEKEKTKVNSTTKKTIANVSEKGNQLYVYDEKGNTISYFYHTGQLFGFSSSIIGSARDNQIYVYDENGKTISYFYFSGKPKNVVGESIVCQDGNQAINYDKNGRETKRYYV